MLSWDIFHNSVCNKHNGEGNISFLAGFIKSTHGFKTFCCLTSRQEDSGEDPFSTLRQ